MADHTTATGKKALLHIVFTKGAISMSGTQNLPIPRRRAQGHALQLQSENKLYYIK